MAASQNNIPIFIGGEGRSGTTLMRVILDSHPNIACGPETHLFQDPKLAELYQYYLTNWGDRIKKYSDKPEEYLGDCFAQMIACFFTAYAKQKNKPRWADKTPYNILALDFYLRIFRSIKFIHMIRDGRDVVCSLLTMDWGPKNMIEAAKSWKSCIETGMKHRGRDYYLEMQYEALVDDLEKNIRLVLEFLAEPFDEKLLSYYKMNHDLGGESSSHQVSKPIYSSSIGRWKKELSAKDLDLFYSIAGDTLKDLDYKI